MSIGCKERQPQYKYINHIYVGDDTVTITNGNVEYSYLTHFLRRGHNDAANKIIYEELHIYPDTIYIHDTIYKVKEVKIDKIRDLYIDQR